MTNLFVKHCRNSIFVWDDEKRIGIVYPATVSTSIEEFTYEVRRIALQQMGYIRFVSLVFNPEFTRNYLPMRAFLNEKEAHCEKFDDDQEKEIYDFLQYEDSWAKDLYNFFFSHAKKVVYPDGYTEYEFKYD